MSCNKLLALCFLFAALALSSGASARGFSRNYGSYGFYGWDRQSVEIFIGGGGSSIYLGPGYLGGGFQYYDYYDDYNTGGFYYDYSWPNGMYRRPPQRCWSHDCGYYRRFPPSYGNDCRHYGGCGRINPRPPWNPGRHYHDHHYRWHEHRR